MTNKLHNTSLLDDLALLDEDDDNPVWEDVDTKQVIQDIQKKDFLGMLPQDKKAIFGENTTKNQNRRLQKQESDDMDLKKLIFDSQKEEEDDTQRPDNNAQRNPQKSQMPYGQESQQQMYQKQQQSQYYQNNQQQGFGY